MCRAEQYLDSNLRKWIETVARREHWRVSRRMPVEDLAGEGYLCFAKCWARYRSMFDIDNPTQEQRNHFRCLVQKAFVNRIHTISVKSQRTIRLAPMRALCEGTEDMVEALSRKLPVLPMQELCCALVRAPDEISDLMHTLAQDTVDAITDNTTQWKRRARKREAIKKFMAFVQT